MNHHFKQFIADRSALSISKLAKELEIDRQTIIKILAGDRKVPNHRRGDFQRIMRKYGYTCPF